jgi:L-arabinose transport system ATP-binding protein
VLVMRDGRISGELSRADASETAVLRLALPDAVDTTDNTPSRSLQ